MAVQIGAKPDSGFDRHSQHANAQRRLSFIILAKMQGTISYTEVDGKWSHITTTGCKQRQ